MLIIWREVERDIAFDRSRPVKSYSHCLPLHASPPTTIVGKTVECRIQRLKEGLSCLRPRLPREDEPGFVVMDSISQPTDTVNEWKATVSHAHELADSAWLEI